MCAIRLLPYVDMREGNVINKKSILFFCDIRGYFFILFLSTEHTEFFPSFLPSHFQPSADDGTNDEKDPLSE